MKTTFSSTLVLNAVKKLGQVSSPELAAMYPTQAKAADKKFPRVATRRAMQALADEGKVELYYVGRELVAVAPGKKPV